MRFRLFAALSIAGLLSALACGELNDPDEGAQGGSGGLADGGGSGGDAGGDGGAAGKGGEGGTGGMGGTAGVGGTAGMGGGGGGGDAPCSPTTYEDPACLSCVENAAGVCEQIANDECPGEFGAVVGCAYLNSCLDEEGLKFDCVFENCFPQAQTLVTCVAANCSAMAACVDL